MWTSDEIRRRLAISTAVFQNERLGEREIAQVKAAGIDAVEISIVRRSFDDQDPKQVSAVLDACRTCEINVVSVHGPFDLPYYDVSEEAERAVVDGSVGPIGFAEEAGARHYVGHFGNDARSRRMLDALVERTSSMAIVLTTENQTGQPLKPYDDFVVSANHDRVRWTLDIGHARDSDKVNPFVKANSAKVLVDACKHVGHTHLHDSFDLPTKPDHRPPLHKDGLIRWVDVFEGLHQVGYNRNFVFEDGRGEDAADWVAHAATFPERFAELTYPGR
jgi:sugar phosphate isomerase/epimerase